MNEGGVCLDLVGVIWDGYFFIDRNILEGLYVGGCSVVIVMFVDYGSCLIVVNVGDVWVVFVKNGIVV